VIFVSESEMIFKQEEDIIIDEKRNMRRKGEAMNMNVILLVQFLGALVLSGAAVIVAVMIIWRTVRRRNDSDKRDGGTKPSNHKMDIALPAEDSPLRELKEKERLADEYCRVTQAIEDIKSEEVYKKIFLRYANVYQILIGLERRLNQNDISDEEFMEEIHMALENSRIGQQLSEKGFLVDEVRVEIDKKHYKSLCLDLSVGELQNDLAKQKKMLDHYQSLMSFKNHILQTGTDMYSVSRAALLDNSEACREAISRMRLKLEKCGCYCIFADHPAFAVDEDMWVDFLDDGPNATELPGLYAKGKKGNYVLIGTCCGTRRT
jgi:hypothetical protein